MTGAGWIRAFLLVAFLAPTFSAAAVLVRRHHAGGLELGWAEALVWQGLVFGTWAPVGWAVAAAVRRLGLTARLFGGLYLFGFPAVAVHSALAIALDRSFGPGRHPDLWRAVEDRAPVDMLVYLALATFVVGLHAQRRAGAEAARARELEAALAAAVREAARPSAPAAPERLLVAVGARRVSVAPDEVDWFGAAGNYVVVNWSGREGLIRETLSGLEARLNPAVFARCHRSAMVNLAKVREAAPLSDGSWRLSVGDGGELVVSRTYRDAFLQRLGREPSRPAAS